MKSLQTELKELIVDALNLEGVDPASIPDDEPLFGEGLDLDSIDALELVLKLEKVYGIRIGSSEESRKALASVNVLAAYIESKGARARSS